MHAEIIKNINYRRLLNITFCGLLLGAFLCEAHLTIVLTIIFLGWALNKNNPRINKIYMWLWFLMGISIVIESLMEYLSNTPALNNYLSLSTPIHRLYASFSMLIGITIIIIWCYLYLCLVAQFYLPLKTIMNDIPNVYTLNIKVILLCAFLLPIVITLTFAFLTPIQAILLASFLSFYFLLP